MKWFVVRRLLWTAFAVYLMLSATFFVFALTPDPNQQLAAQAAAMEAASQYENPNEAASEAEQAYAEARNRDRPLVDRYADWIVGYATGNWGWSYSQNGPVVAVLWDALLTTLAYLLPGVFLGTAASVLAGLYGALNRTDPLDRLLQALMFLGIAVPSFVLAVLIPRVGPAWLQGQVVTPAFIVGLNLFAVQTWLVRSDALQLVPQEFVKTLRASGAGDVTIGRHILRNTTSSLLAMFVSQVLVVLYVTVFVVEIILGVPGIGGVGFEAFQDRDIGLILAVVMLPVVIGMTGTLLKDVLSAYIDPRITR
jgi:peptide/nickel transport system permease protein